ELLVECALQVLAGRPVIVDVGTGSGAVAVALAVKSKGCGEWGDAKHRPTPHYSPPPSPAHVAGVVGATVIATDISLDALAVARVNAARYGLGETIQFVQCDLLANIGRVDLVVANLPYVARDEWGDLAREITEYEPRVALDGGADGLDLFRQFFAQAPAHLAPA